MADLEALLDDEAGNVALLLGNGINRYGAANRLQTPTATIAPGFQKTRVNFDASPT